MLPSFLLAALVDIAHHMAGENKQWIFDKVVENLLEAMEFSRLTAPTQKGKMATRLASIAKALKFAVRQQSGRRASNEIWDPTIKRLTRLSSTAWAEFYQKSKGQWRVDRLEDDFLKGHHPDRLDSEMLAGALSLDCCLFIADAMRDRDASSTDEFSSYVSVACERLRLAIMLWAKMHEDNAIEKDWAAQIATVAADISDALRHLPSES